MDCDLTENEEYFKDDTLELGFENEADRRVKEALVEFGQPTTAEEFEKVADKVFESISNEEYWGLCALQVKDLGQITSVRKSFWLWYSVCIALYSVLTCVN